MRKLMSAMLGLTFALGAVSLASANAADAAADFKKLDTDKDGKISKAEWVAGNETEQSEEQAVAKFMQADKDKDGYLSLEEHKAISETKKEKNPPLL